MPSLKNHGTVFLERITMKNTQRQLTDILILRQLFFSKNNQLIIFDSSENFQIVEESNVTICYSPAELLFVCNDINTNFVFVNLCEVLTEKSITIISELASCEGVIDFHKKYNNTFTDFDYFNNPDQTMRWVFPRNSKSPSFLNLYNGSGVKASLFKNATKCLHQINCLKAITSGKFSVLFKNENWMEQHCGDLNFDSYAIFTGTVGENRKAIIALTENKRCTQFIKIPLTNAAKKLVQNEWQQLNEIATTDFKFLKQPNVRRTATGIAVSNVQPDYHLKEINLQAVHFNALDELYEMSAETNRVVDLPIWESIKNGMDFLQKLEKTENDLSINKVKALKEVCEGIFYNINITDSIKVGMAHGDFTPWNMYVSENKLFVYDWEMCQSDMPLLFDIFHYVFQKGILIEKKDFNSIKKEIETQLSSSEAKNIISKYNIDWESHYQIYLLYIITYYLPKYATQPQLHEQVHWLTDTWVAASKYMTSNFHTQS